MRFWSTVNPRLASDLLSTATSAVTLTASSMGPDLEHDREVAGLADLELQPVLEVLLEARHLDRHLVGAGEQVVDLEQALTAGRRGDRRAPGRVRDDHGGPGNRRSGRVQHVARDSPARFLSVQERREEKQRRQEPPGAAQVAGWGPFRFHLTSPFGLERWAGIRRRSVRAESPAAEQAAGRCDAHASISTGRARRPGRRPRCRGVQVGPTFPNGARQTLRALPPRLTNRQEH